jgi:hypothetical protein
VAWAPAALAPYQAAAAAAAQYLRFPSSFFLNYCVPIAVRRESKESDLTGHRPAPAPALQMLTATASRSPAPCAQQHSAEPPAVQATRFQLLNQAAPCCPH